MPQWSTVLALLGCLVVFWFVKALLGARKVLADVNNLPGARTALGQAASLGPWFPRIPFISEGRHAIWDGKHEVFAQGGWDAYSSLELIPKPAVLLRVADADAIKEMTGNRTRFPKPTELYDALGLWGRNIVVSEGDEWKKHRKTANPAFTERNLGLAFQETISTMQELFNTQWAGREEIQVQDACEEVTLVAALHVISAAAFGFRLSWSDEGPVPKGHRMRFKEVMHIVSHDIITRLLVPPWARNLTAGIRRVYMGFDELTLYMQELIDARRSGEKAEEKVDLFSNLLAASEEEAEDRIKLTDQELISNIYMFLLAGHETSGHTLGFAINALALYQDEQERLYEHTKQVLPDGRVPTHDDLSQLTRVTAVLHETLRMFPSVIGIPKTVPEDTTLKVGGLAPPGEKFTLPIPKGSYISIDAVGLHYNPRYWSDPYTFKPDRFLAPDWPRDAFIPFSGGSRSCIGRRFFETSAAAILTLLVMNYKFELVQDPKHASETFEQRRARIMDARSGITLTPNPVPLVFKRR